MHSTTFVLATALASLPAIALAQPANGFYGGFTVAYNLGDGELNIPAYTPSNYAVDVDGASFGAFAGYNFPSSGGFVFGVEAGANLLNTSGSVPTVIANEIFSVDGDWEASLVARVGGMAGNMFIYALGGATMMQVTGQYTGFPSHSDSQVGWTVGLGAETGTGNGGFIRGEVRYSGYPTFDLQCSLCGPTNLDLNNVTIGFGVGFDF